MVSSAALGLVHALLLGMATKTPLFAAIRAPFRLNRSPKTLPPPVPPPSSPPLPIDPRDLGDVTELEAQITQTMQATGAFEDPSSVLEVQNLLYRRFQDKYTGEGRPFPRDYLGTLTPERQRLLVALRRGDVQAIRDSIEAGSDWNFVFPPAPTGGTRATRLLREGWCRSPLALLVRPDEGSLQPLLPGVSKVERLALVAAALRSGSRPLSTPVAGERHTAGPRPQPAVPPRPVC